MTTTFSAAPNESDVDESKKAKTPSCSMEIHQCTNAGTLLNFGDIFRRKFIKKSRQRVQSERIFSRKYVATQHNTKHATNKSSQMNLLHILCFCFMFLSVCVRFYFCKFFGKQKKTAWNMPCEQSFPISMRPSLHFREKKIGERFSVLMGVVLIEFSSRIELYCQKSLIKPKRKKNSVTFKY